MKSFDTEVTKYAEKTTHLKAGERHELRERVLSYMEYHPLPKQFEIPASVSPFAFLTAIKPGQLRIATGAFMFFVAIVSIPFVAERSVPGDVLYPIKTGLNEGFRAQFANSPYEKVAFETELLERRISEARLLAKEGKLSGEKEAEIIETVKIHANAVQEGIAELKNSDVDEGAIAEIAFGSALDVQSAVLDSAHAQGGGEATLSLAGAVRAVKATADAERSTTTPSYDRLMARVERETTRAYELSNSIGVAATPEERSDIERRLADIERKLVEARDAHANAGTETGSAEDTALFMAKSAAPVSGVATLVATLGDIQKLILFMTDIDVRSNVKLETLVPVVLTKEEREVRVEKSLGELEASFEALRPRIETVEDGSLMTSLAEKVEWFDEALTRAKEAEDVAEAEVALTEAEALRAEIEALLATPEGIEEGE